MAKHHRFGTKSKHELRLIHSNFQSAICWALKDCEIDFAVHDGARTAAEQNYLYQQGRSRGGNIVTSKDGYRKKSNHQISKDNVGYAVDLVPYVDGRLQWDWDEIYKIAVSMGRAAKRFNLNIRWGGNWYGLLNDYPTTIEGCKQAVEYYKAAHPGPDFIDGPHFELIT